MRRGLDVSRSGEGRQAFLPPSEVRYRDLSSVSHVDRRSSERNFSALKSFAVAVRKAGQRSAKEMLHDHFGFRNVDPNFSSHALPARPRQNNRSASRPVIALSWADCEDPTRTTGSSGSQCSTSRSSMDWSPARPMRCSRLALMFGVARSLEPTGVVGLDCEKFCALNVRLGFGQPRRRRPTGWRRSGGLFGLARSAKRSQSGP